MPKKRPYEQFCPITTALDRVGDRWTLPILRELFVGPMRYGELHRALSPISTDVLAGRLKDLEGQGMIGRHPNHGGYGYDLTEEGRQIAPVLEALGAWGAGQMRPPTNGEALSADRLMQMIAIAGATDTSNDEQRAEVDADGSVYSITRNASGTVVRRESAKDPHAALATSGSTLWRLGAGVLSWDEAVASGAVVVDGDARAAQVLVVLHHLIPLT